MERVRELPWAWEPLPEAGEEPLPEAGEEPLPEWWAEEPAGARDAGQAGGRELAWEVAI